MDKEIKELVDLFIADAPSLMADRDKLSKMPKEQLQSLAAIKKADPAFNFALSATPAPANNGNGAPSPSPAPTPVAPKPGSAPIPAEQIGGAPKPITVNEYIAAAPPEVAAMLQNALDSENEQKATLLTLITANENNPFSKEELVSKTLRELRQLARLMGSKPEPQNNRVPLYAGQGPTPTDNAQAEEALVMPQISFGK